MKKICFIHCCTINNGLIILKELLDRIIDSNLIDYLERIYICILGDFTDDNIENIINYNSKISICFKDNNIKLYEYPCLKELYNFSLKTEENYHILYIHTKGVFKPYLYGEHQWRKYMSYFMINNFKICNKKLLNGYDTVGCELYKDTIYKYKYYAGNFWWANSNYISNNLLNPDIFLKDTKYYINNNIDRFYAEKWLFMTNKKVFPYNMFGIYRNYIREPIKLKEYINGEDYKQFYLYLLKKNHIKNNTNKYIK
jgi:hypothetical protein